MYPSYRYHRTERPVVVNDPAHELEVAHPDAGWAPTPAAFLEASVDPGDDATLNATDAPAAADWQPPAAMDDSADAPATPAAKPAKRKR